MKTKMVIYPQEQKDGLADLLLDPAKAMVSLASLAEPLTKEELHNFDILKNRKIFEDFAKAELSDEDLYPLKTVLVSTVWNKNDDVFTPVETWAARHTPEDKPFNNGHVESDIIGHITDNQCFDVDFKIIADQTPVNELPDKFHIVTAAVLYRHYRDKTLKDRIEAIIADIQEKKKFVSMECWFQGFDYAIKAQDGQNYIVARTPETAFLSKHLRAYGGTGEYDNHKVGRILKSIAFTGKGLVDNPANPESVVLASVLRDFNPQYTVAHLITPKIEKEKNVMENDKLITELQAELAALKVERDGLNKKLKDVDSQAAQAKVTTLEATVVATEKKVAELQASVATLTQTNEQLAKAKEDAEKSAKASGEELAKIRAEQVKTSRIAKLVTAGLTEDEAKAKVEKLLTVADDIFEEIVSLAGMDWKKEKEEKKEKKGDKKKKAEADVDADDADASGEDDEELEDTEAEEDAALASETDDESEEQTGVLTAISSYLEGKLNQKKHK
jgi:hypothetical protein